MRTLLSKNQYFGFQEGINDLQYDVIETCSTLSGTRSNKPQDVF